MLVEEGGRGEEEKEELRLRAELKSVEAELESYKQAASAEERDKAEILTAEKKARSQVPIYAICIYNVFCFAH